MGEAAGSTPAIRSSDADACEAAQPVAAGKAQANVKASAPAAMRNFPARGPMPVLSSGFAHSTMTVATAGADRLPCRFDLQQKVAASWTKRARFRRFSWSQSVFVKRFSRKRLVNYEKTGSFSKGDKESRRFCPVAGRRFRPAKEAFCPGAGRRTPPVMCVLRAFFLRLDAV